MRKIIAKRLAESLFSAPHYNLVIEVTMDDAMAARAVINNVPDTKVSFNDYMVVRPGIEKHQKSIHNGREMLLPSTITSILVLLWLLKMV
jgi:pyruvate dehydrogenase E2 component (dihydrolipoamide acetyltransferase)